MAACWRCVGNDICHCHLFAITLPSHCNAIAMSLPMRAHQDQQQRTSRPRGSTGVEAYDDDDGDGYGDDAFAPTDVEASGDDDDDGD